MEAMIFFKLSVTCGSPCKTSYNVSEQKLNFCSKKVNFLETKTISIQITYSSTMFFILSKVFNMLSSFDLSLLADISPGRSHVQGRVS